MYVVHVSLKRLAFKEKFDTVKHEIRIRNAYDVYALETL